MCNSAIDLIIRLFYDWLFLTASVRRPAFALAADAATEAQPDAGAQTETRPVYWDPEDGFVDTPMTASFKKGALWASPDAIAQGIVGAIDKKRDVVYLPGFWWLIMTLIRHIPERIFKKLSL